MLKIINCSNKSVLDGESGSLYIQYAPSQLCAITEKQSKWLKKQKNTRMLRSPQNPCRYLETNIKQHLVMNNGWRWRCTRPVSYLQSHKNILVELATWHVVLYAMTHFYILVWSQKRHKFRLHALGDYSQSNLSIILAEYITFFDQYCVHLFPMQQELR